ncbi:MAG: D-sedoheptulose 7-phosphate isomerase [Bacteroidetes bacterium]|nr:D-sedoheptulose 7-phosphate isomerase [Bacteroidota bacterium]
MKQLFRNNFNEALDVLKKFISDEKNLDKLEKAGQLLLKSIRSGGKILSCGNGGSMSDAMHFAEELTGRFRGNRDSIPAIAISDPAHLTCTANDFGYDFVFSRFIEGVGKKGDILFAISTSGNSANVINAIYAAKEKGMKVIGLTGKNGGKMADLCDVEIRAPETKYSDRVQEIHIKVIHSLVHYIEEQLI